MELCAVEVFILESGGEQIRMAARGYCVGAKRRIIAVNEIHIASRRYLAKQFCLKVGYAAPSHVRYLQAGMVLKAADMGIEYPETFRVSLFRCAAHDLHSDTNAEDGAPQPADDIRELPVAQILHSLAGVAYTGEDHMGCLFNYHGIGGEGPFGTQTAQGVSERPYVAHAIVNDCNHRVPLLEGRAVLKGFRAIAMRRARAKALNIPSAI